MGNENWFKKLAVKLQCLTKRRETTFGSSCQEVREIEVSRNRDSLYFIYRLDNQYKGYS